MSSPSCLDRISAIPSEVPAPRSRPGLAQHPVVEGVASTSSTAGGESVLAVRVAAHDHRYRLVGRRPIAVKASIPDGYQHVAIDDHRRLRLGHPDRRVDHACQASNGVAERARPSPRFVEAGSVVCDVPGRSVIKIQSDDGTHKAGGELPLPARNPQFTTSVERFLGLDHVRSHCFAASILSL